MTSEISPAMATQASRVPVGLGFEDTFSRTVRILRDDAVIYHSRTPDQMTTLLSTDLIVISLKMRVATEVFRRVTPETKRERGAMGGGVFTSRRPILPAS